MRAFTLWEPWASAMALKVKTIETRSWYTDYRGLLAICSAQRKMTQDDQETFDILIAPDAPTGFKVTYGAVLCIVELYDCIPTEKVSSVDHPIRGSEIALGDYGPGRYAWLTRNCRTLPKPVPVRGHQGFWRLPAAVDAQVREQLGNL